jgi:hypothetical protein
MLPIVNDLLPVTVTCNVCRREVPHIESLSAEGRDYLYFFCGTGCYEQWRSGAATHTQVHGRPATDSGGN